MACLQRVLRVYEVGGFQVPTILADPEFQPLNATFGPQLNCCGADEHVPDVQRYIGTVKDYICSGYNMLPFASIPRIVLVHLVKNAVFWLNSFPALDGVSNTVYPRYILTGHNESCDKHVCLELGAYVQTHEQHDNTLQSRTVGAICHGPTGNLYILLHEPQHWTTHHTPSLDRTAYPH